MEDEVEFFQRQPPDAHVGAAPGVQRLAAVGGEVQVLAIRGPEGFGFRHAGVRQVDRLSVGQAVDEDVLLEIAEGGEGDVAAVGGEARRAVVEAPQFVRHEGAALEILQVHEPDLVPAAEVDRLGAFGVERQGAVGLPVEGELLLLRLAVGGDPEPVQPAVDGLVVQERPVVGQPGDLHRPALGPGGHLADVLPLDVRDEQPAPRDERQLLAVGRHAERRDLARHLELLLEGQGIDPEHFDGQPAGLLPGHVVDPELVILLEDHPAAVRAGLGHAERRVEAGQGLLLPARQAVQVELAVPLVGDEVEGARPVEGGLIVLAAPGGMDLELAGLRVPRLDVRVVVALVALAVGEAEALPTVGEEVRAALRVLRDGVGGVEVVRHQPPGGAAAGVHGVGREIVVPAGSEVDRSRVPRPGIHQVVGLVPGEAGDGAAGRGHDIHVRVARLVGAEGDGPAVGRVARPLFLAVHAGEADGGAAGGRHAPDIAGVGEDDGLAVRRQAGVGQEVRLRRGGRGRQGQETQQHAHGSHNVSSQVEFQRD